MFKVYQRVREVFNRILNFKNIIWISVLVCKNSNFMSTVFEPLKCIIISDLYLQKHIFRLTRILSTTSAEIYSKLF